MNFDIYNGSDTERYVLGTTGNRALIVIGINPSEANKERSDKTISRVIKYADMFGFDSFRMINIYPLRAKIFKDLPSEIDKRLHEQNLIEIRKSVAQASAILCAWGTHINDRRYFKECYDDIVEIISGANIPTYCLGVTKHGHPLHPLLRGIPAPKELIEFDMKRYSI